jgi:hypothetical protein
MNYSIKDALNSFGSASTAGPLPNNIYVGKGTNRVQARADSQGGEAGIPHFAEFRALGTTIPTAAASLIVEGAPDNGGASAPAAGWTTVGRLDIPAGAWQKDGTYRVAFSDSPYKWFRCSIAGTGTASIQAFLFRG